MWEEFETLLYMWETLQIGAIKTRVIPLKISILDKGLTWEYTFYGGREFWKRDGLQIRPVDPEYIYIVNLTTKTVYKREDLTDET